MERISTVARDRGARHHCWYVCLVVCAASLGLAFEIAGQEAPRPRPKTARPQRPMQAQRSTPDQTAESQETVDDGFGSISPNKGATNPAAEVDQLPAHVHPKHPLVPALKMAYTSRGTLRNVRDYTAQFVKKELVGNRYITHSMDMKFREQPFSVYLRFRDPHEGRQVLFVKNANAGQILVQEAGIKSLVGTVTISPLAPMAMSENRHPITEIGISNMLETIIKQWEAEAQYGEIDVQYFPKAKLGEFPVRVIRATHPTRRNQFKFHMTQ
ncbi:MAG: hypothetical protein JWN70_5031, partial [Planctomycetaceae bacterium]|nr:hypothetical protein [Planctomycetaceae bacterium]